MRWRRSYAYCIAGNNTRQHKRPPSCLGKVTSEPQLLLQIWRRKSKLAGILAEGDRNNICCCFIWFALVMSLCPRVTVCFVEECGNSSESKCNFWQALEMRECTYRLLPLQWEAFFKDVWKSSNKSFSWWLILQNSACRVYCKGFLNQLTGACKSLIRSYARAGPFLVTPLKSIKFLYKSVLEVTPQ